MYAAADWEVCWYAGTPRWGGTNPAGNGGGGGCDACGTNHRCCGAGVCSPGITTGAAVDAASWLLTLYGECCCSGHEWRTRSLRVGGGTDGGGGGGATCGAGACAGEPSRQ